MRTWKRLVTARLIFSGKPALKAQTPALQVSWSELKNKCQTRFWPRCQDTAPHQRTSRRKPSTDSAHRQCSPTLLTDTAHRLSGNLKLRRATWLISLFCRIFIIFIKNLNAGEGGQVCLALNIMGCWNERAQGRTSADVLNVNKCWLSDFFLFSRSCRVMLWHWEVIPQRPLSSYTCPFLDCWRRSYR